MTQSELIKKLAAALDSAGFESARFEATQIAEAVCGHGSDGVTHTQADAAEQMLQKRLQNEPLQYILGEWEFCGLPFKVGKGVLIPRQDTETLVETALPILKNGGKNVLDLCAGSGCIGIALEKLSGATVKMFEKSGDALKYLNENIALNGSSAEVFEFDVLGEPPANIKADMIVSNPPYIRREVLDTLSPEVKCEPTMALDGGEDGLIFYRHIANNWKKVLNIGGHLIFEIGFDQADEVTEIMRQAGFSDVVCKKDLCGQPRVVLGHI